MDDLLSEFLTETAESIDVVDAELVKFEQNPNDGQILGNIFRLVHTIKGTCGFLGLPRLEALAHAAETLMGGYRDGAPVTVEGVSVILSTLDRIKELLAALEKTGAEPEGADADLIARLEAFSAASPAAPASREDSLEELEEAFQATPGPDGPGAGTGAGQPVVSGEGPARTQSIRVNVDTLEHLMTMVSELVLTRNQLLEMVRRLDDSEFKTPLQRLSNVTAELQEGVMKTRMQPIGNAWSKLPRIIRDLCRDLNKKIDLQMTGAETELDRQVLEMIRDPLTHMIRNSADHGLEDTAGRLRAGKPETGSIRLSAYHEGGHIIIEIADDGRGLDTARIRAKALEHGLATPEEIAGMSEAQIHRFIFDAGFSTAASVTSISGRGVGMDVVRNNIELIGGSVGVKSVQGEGTVFTVKIPLTLAIISALIVESGGQRFAVPQLNVAELVRTHAKSGHRIETIKDTPVLRLRNKLLPLIHLGRLLGLERAGAPPGEAGAADGQDLFVVVTHVGAQQFGIVVDSVFDTEEIVVKPMSAMLRDIQLFSGNTILGDGSVIMIVDPNGIAQTIAATAASQASRTAQPEEQEDGPAAADATALLLFRAASREPKAVPLPLVTRLEEIDVSDIERSNGMDMVQYHGSLMPLVYIGGKGETRSGNRLPVLVFTDADRSMGLVVDEIIDIVEDHLRIEVAAGTPGLLGSAIVQGRATEIIDLTYYLEQAFADWREAGRGRAVRRGMRLLLVDDSAFFRNMLAPLLSSVGYRVTLADSAQAALDLRKTGTRFDVIVSDIEMPGMDGIAFAEAVRRDPEWRHTPIIALSSHSTPQVIERSREAGFADFVGKFDRQGLIESLRDCSAGLGAAA